MDSKSSNKTNVPRAELFLFRHGEKAFMISQDPVLTERGQTQAQNLATSVKKQFLPKPKQVLSSPKKRAVLTFTPLSETCHLKLNISDLLIERKLDETTAQFDLRMKDLASELTKNTLANSVVYAVTHSDVIEKVLSYAPFLNEDSEPPRHLIALGSCYYLNFEIDQNGFWIFKAHGGGFI
jgi:broad specificity phosphatase PhoE